ncbi:dephospho-CoA kinase [Candidatus Zixiibacteriota bacterium]
MIRKICVTGGIASGKTTVVDLFARLGGIVVSADEIARSLMLDRAIQDELTTALGRSFFSSSGEIMTGELAGHLFSNPESLQTVNEIVHPHVYREVERRFNELAHDRSCCFVVETALAVETGFADWFDTVIVVTAESDERLRRLVEVRQLSGEEAQLRIDSQLPQQAKVERADLVLENDGTIEDLKVKTVTLFRELCDHE